MEQEKKKGREGGREGKAGSGPTRPPGLRPPPREENKEGEGERERESNGWQERRWEGHRRTAKALG